MFRESSLLALWFIRELLADHRRSWTGEHVCALLQVAGFGSGTLGASEDEDGEMSGKLDLHLSRRDLWQQYSLFALEHYCELGFLLFSTNARL